MDAYFKKVSNLPTRRIKLGCSLPVVSSSHQCVKTWLQDFINEALYQRMLKDEIDAVEIRGSSTTCIIASFSHHRPPHIRTILWNFQKDKELPTVTSYDFCPNELEMRFEHERTAVTKYKAITPKLPCPLPTCLEKLRQDKVNFSYCLPVLGDTKHGPVVHLKSVSDVYGFILDEVSYENWSLLVWKQEKVTFRRPGLLLELLFDKTRHVKTHLVTMTQYPGAIYTFCLYLFPLGFEQHYRCSAKSTDMIKQCKTGKCFHGFTKPPLRYLQDQERRQRETPEVAPDWTDWEGIMAMFDGCALGRPACPPRGCSCKRDKERETKTCVKDKQTSDVQKC